MEDPRLELDRMITGLTGEGYTRTAVDHALDPKNLGSMGDADGYACYTGPCGDTMEIWVKARGGRVERASFCTDGCGSSTACGSMVTEMARGLELSRAAGIGQEDVLEQLGGLPEESRHCALLAAATLRMAVEDCKERE